MSSASNVLSANKNAFIEFVMAEGVLGFGEFTLKSGRVSPYFFNAGLFHSGRSLAALGGFYAQALQDEQVTFDLLFGPAYKGIPLVSATSIALAAATGREVPFAFNRKEVKDHGEGGQLVGAPLEGQVVIVDDVITAGTAIREIMTILDDTPATVAGVIVAIDRQEKGQGEKSAIQEVEQEYGVSVTSIVKLDDIIEYLEAGDHGDIAVDRIIEYRETYGVSG